MIYEYTECDRFAQPNTYMYTAFHGLDFIKEYFRIRNEASQTLESLGSNAIEDRVSIVLTQTERELETIKDNIVSKASHIWKTEVDCYVRRFEVAKRLRNYYPVTCQDDMAPLQAHVLFYEVLISAYAISGDLRYLNVMLKLGDSLISVRGSINDTKIAKRLSICIQREIAFIGLLTKNQAINL